MSPPDRPRARFRRWPRRGPRTPPLAILAIVLACAPETPPRPERADRPDAAEGAAARMRPRATTRRSRRGADLRGRSRRVPGHEVARCDPRGEPRPRARLAARRSRATAGHGVGRQLPRVRRGRHGRAHHRCARCIRGARAGPGPVEQGRAARGSQAPPQAAAQTGEIVVYKTAWCGVCKKLEGYLKRKGVQYAAKDIEKDPQAAAELRSKAAGKGIKTSSVPVIDVRGELIVGFDRAGSKSCSDRGSARERGEQLVGGDERAQHQRRLRCARLGGGERLAEHAARRRSAARRAARRRRRTASARPARGSRR